MVPDRSQRAGGRPRDCLGLADPAPQRGIAVEVKAAFMRQAGIGQQRDVGEREAIADQKSRRGELMLHPRQRRIAALDLVGIEIGCRLAQIFHLEAAHRDIGLVAVLLPEQPFVHLRGGKCVGGNEIAAAGEISDDGVGLRQRAAVIEFDRRHLARAVELEKWRGAGLALERVDGDPAIGQREPVADPFHLQAIARIGIAVDFHQCAGLPGQRRHRTSRVNSCQGRRCRADSELVTDPGPQRCSC